MGNNSPYDISTSSKEKNQSFTSSYPESQSPSTSGSSAAQRFHQQSQLSFLQPDGKPYLFPSIFGVYRDGPTKLFLSQHHITTPFMLVTTQPGLSDEPSITLSSPTMAMGTAHFHGLASKVDVVVGITSTSLQSSGLLSPVWDFTYTFDDGRQEVFEWKRSSGKEVAGLGGKSKGHKLVRKSNGEVIAAWAQPGGTSSDKLAKIGLLDSGRLHDWGERWEVTVVLGAVALVERERRARDNAASAA